jgi:hypothetical protein
MKNTHTILLTALYFFSFSSFSQGITVKAICGEGTYVNWPEIKTIYEENEMSEGEGPGFFYNDCDQGISPLRASSTLANQGKFNYNIKNINDDNPMTAWVEGSVDYGIGVFFEIKASSINIIYNGYQSSPKSWMENSRVKKFKVYKNNVALCYLELTDEMGRQSFELPGHNNYNPEMDYNFKFEIMEVYKGTKWKDVAISEINLSLCCVSQSTQIGNASTPLIAADLQKGTTIYSINLETGDVVNAAVLSVSKQRHLSMLEITTETKTLSLTSNHPIFMKNYGFSSISRYMLTHQVDNYEDLIDHVEFAIWNENTCSINYEKLKKIQLVNGDFQTYTIGKLSQGDTFITNGFISRLY